MELITPLPEPTATPIVIDIEKVPLQERLEDLRAKVEDYCREEPAKALLIAIAAGFVVGKLLHMLVKNDRARAIDGE